MKKATIYFTGGVAPQTFVYEEVFFEADGRILRFVANGYPDVLVSMYNVYKVTVE